MLKSAQTSAKRRWEEGEPTRKAAHHVERNFWFSSTVEHFEGIIRNARKKGILHGTTLWSLAALMWVPGPATLFVLHKDISLQIFFFLLILAKKDFAQRKTSTKPDNVNNTNTMTKNLCR